MVITKLKETGILSALQFLEETIAQRIKAHFAQKHFAFDKVKYKKLLSEKSLVAHFIKEFGLDQEEVLVLLLALVPHLAPTFLERVIKTHLPADGDFPLLGGIKGKQSRTMLPTGQTALFLLAGVDLEAQLSAQQLFDESHLFASKKILWLENVPEGEPRMSGKIVLSPDYFDLLTTGTYSEPKFSTQFPAEKIETEMEWEDLVLPPQTMEQIQELEYFIKHGKTLLVDWGMKKRVKPGFRVLFFGRPGTGKTLTVTLLGKNAQKPVYRVDLSMVISKFIGETEKNLAKLFAKAENKDWILFFDEADALFGKRTNIRDAHDKYANQEVAYLLQRIEAYNGLVILATNQKSNIDEAFLRRFQSIINFPLPKVNERLLLWQKALPAKARLDANIDLRNIARQNELTGAGIVNVIQTFSLKALGTGNSLITEKDILEAIRKEHLKEGRII